MLRNNRSLLILLLLAIAIKLFSLFPEAVEKYYSNGLYPVIARIQRSLLGWIPFSVGDVLYGIAAIYLVISTIKFGILIAKRRTNKYPIKRALLKSARVLLVVYLWFNISWGLNYNRIPIGKKLKLEHAQYSTEDLRIVMEQLVNRVNTLRPQAVENRMKLKRKKYLFGGAVSSYKNLLSTDSLFKYNISAVKPSIYSYLGNYMGFTGYYNPFTGEAQVNTTVPVFILPFTTCHEIGHQLGYAKEREANLAAFLSARASTDPAFLYSVYFEMYSYSRRYMYEADSLQLRRLDSALSEGVRKDYRDLREFYQQHANPVEVLIDRLYSNYLRANEQPAGRVSYNEVVLLLMAVYRKYGEI